MTGLIDLAKLPVGDVQAIDQAVAGQPAAKVLAIAASAAAEAARTESPSRPLVEAVDAIPEPRLRSVVATAFSVAGLRVGEVAEVPIQILTESGMNARFFYSTEEVDEMATSLQRNGQDTPVAAYEQGGKLHVFDGVKRLRGARSGGVESLRVELHAKPDSPWDVYMRSRRMNLERSAQTAIDDAVRWQEMLDSKIVASQADLAKRLGKDPSYISHILAINRIPRGLVSWMKDVPGATDYMVAYYLSMVFDADKYPEHTEEARLNMARTIIDEIKTGELGRDASVALIQRRMGTPRVRAKSDHHKVRFFGRDAMIKVFPSKGRVDFSVSGLKIDQIAKLEEAIKTIAQANAEA